MAPQNASRNPFVHFCSRCHDGLFWAASSYRHAQTQQAEAPGMHIIAGSPAQQASSHPAFTAHPILPVTQIAGGDSTADSLSRQPTKGRSGRQKEIRTESSITEGGPTWPALGPRSTVMSRVDGTRTLGSACCRADKSGQGIDLSGRRPWPGLASSALLCTPPSTLPTPLPFIHSPRTNQPGPTIQKAGRYGRSWPLSRARLRTSA